MRSIVFVHVAVKSYIAARVTVVYDMKQLSRFKVIHNMLVYGEYKILITPYYKRYEGNYLKFVVYYKDKEIFSSDEKDTLEDIIEVIFELEKDDQDFKDRESLRLCLTKILEKSK